MTHADGGKVKRYWTKLYYMSTERTLPTSLTGDTEVILASDYAQLEQRLAKAKAWAQREYAGRAAILKFVLRLKDLLGTDDESESIVTAITALQHRAEQAEAQAAEYRTALTEAECDLESCEQKREQAEARCIQLEKEIEQCKKSGNQ